MRLFRFTTLTILTLACGLCGCAKNDDKKVVPTALIDTASPQKGKTNESDGNTKQSPISEGGTGNFGTSGKSKGPSYPPNVAMIDASQTAVLKNFNSNLIFNSDQGSDAMRSLEPYNMRLLIKDAEALRDPTGGPKWASGDGKVNAFHDSSIGKCEISLGKNIKTGDFAQFYIGQGGSIEERSLIQFYMTTEKVENSGNQTPGYHFVNSNDNRVVLSCVVTKGASLSIGEIESIFESHVEFVSLKNE